MSQIKEQMKPPEKEPSKMEASHLPDTEFKIMVVKMVKDLRENFKKR